MEREELLKARALQFLAQDRYNDRVRSLRYPTAEMTMEANIWTVQA